MCAMSRGNSGSKKTLTYQLMKEGQIESTLVKGRGKSRGKRLFNFASIRQLLEAEVL
jgi:hypothetical protein